MLTSFRGLNIVVGTKRVVKALDSGVVKTVYLALDADLYIKNMVEDAARRNSVPVVEVPAKKELGEAAGVDVKTAAVALLKG